MKGSPKVTLTPKSRKGKHLEGYQSLVVIHGQDRIVTLARFLMEQRIG